jgi:hypothetical protein
MATERVSVDCYSGSAYATRLRRFSSRGVERQVRAVIRTWRTPGAIGFTVCTDRDEIATLTYYEDECAWVVAAPLFLEESPR